MSQRGHNENAFRLDTLAEDARRGLTRVAQGESDALEGWLAYGVALNEGRGLFAEDRTFGEWVTKNLTDKLSVSPNDHERAAAMWAAANADQFAEARAAGNARTVRGIYAKWKEIEAAREKEAKRLAAEQAAAERRAEAETAEAKEAEARAQAEAAETDEARTAAEGLADALAAERDEAKAEADDAEAEAAALAPPPAADPARTEAAKLTREALEDDWVGLRAENAELRASLDARSAEIERDKALIADLSKSDLGPVVSKLKSTMEGLKYQLKNAQDAARRADYLRKQAEKRVAELESAGIVL